MTDLREDFADEEGLVLSDLLSHVLDKGVVITGDVIISIGGIDLIGVSISVLITAIETLERRNLSVSGRLASSRDLSVLSPPREA